MAVGSFGDYPVYSSENDIQPMRYKAGAVNAQSGDTVSFHL